jgi:hypothetical protein
MCHDRLCGSPALASLLPCPVPVCAHVDLCVSRMQQSLSVPPATLSLEVMPHCQLRQPSVCAYMAMISTPVLTSVVLHAHVAHCTDFQLQAGTDTEIGEAWIQQARRRTLTCISSPCAQMTPAPGASTVLRHASVCPRSLHTVACARLFVLLPWPREITAHPGLCGGVRLQEHHCPGLLCPAAEHVGGRVAPLRCALVW